VGYGYVRPANTCPIRVAAGPAGLNRRGPASVSCSRLREEIRGHEPRHGIGADHEADPVDKASSADDGPRDIELPAFFSLSWLRRKGARVPDDTFFR
jgi:hypothetical protein